MRAKTLGASTISQISAWSLIAILTNSGMARADNFFAGLINVATFIPRQIIKPFTDDALNSMDDSVKKAVLEFRENLVFPALERVDYILTQKIQELQPLANDLIKQIESAGQKIIKAGADSIAKIISDSTQKIEAILSNIVNIFVRLINESLCKIAPSGHGILLNIGPLTDNSNSARVYWPGRSECWRAFLPDSNRDPFWQTFSGWQYHKGYLCEIETSRHEIRIDDADGVARLREVYSNYVAAAKAAICEAKSEADQEWLMKRIARYERLLNFYSKSISPMLSNQRETQNAPKERP